MFDMYLAFAFGILGYIARKTGYHVSAILIGVILGPLLERFMLISLQKADGEISVLFSSTLGNILWVALIVTLFLPSFLKLRRRRAQPAESVFASGEG
jgi:putative tricarboxylic transport membrane protein